MPRNTPSTVGEERRRLDARVVDQYIETAKATNDFRHCRDPICFTSHIVMQELDAARMQCDELRLRAPADVVEHVGEQHAGAHLQQRIGDLGSKPAGATRDECDLAIEAGSYAVIHRFGPQLSSAARCRTRAH
jgi:hypothetical protein